MDIRGQRHRLGRAASSLSTIRCGQYATAHFPHTPSLGDTLESLGFSHVLIIRDPRDVVVSDAIYMSRTPKHRHYDTFRRLDLEQAIQATIVGFPGGQSTPGLESIGDRIRNYLPWLNDPRVLICRFEDVVGARGGGPIRIRSTSSPGLGYT